MSSDIVRPTQASRGEEPCQSPSEGTKEQTNLLPGVHAKTCMCLCCGLTSRCCIQPAQPADTTYCIAFVLKRAYALTVQFLCLHRWNSQGHPSAIQVPQDVRHVHTSGVDHFSRHNMLDLQNDCLLTCVRCTTTLCLGDMSMLAFTASELRIVQSLEQWAVADHWEHYSQHGPILNVASLLYFLLLLPLDSLCHLDRARLV